MLGILHGEYLIYKHKNRYFPILKTAFFVYNVLMNTLYKNALIIVVCLVILFGLMSIVKPKPGQDSNLDVNQEENIINEEINNNEQTNNMDTQNSEVERVVVSGDTISVNYTGRLTDGTVFDSNVLPEKGHVTPFIFTIGEGRVIQGWEEGFLGMKVGEKRTLTIPPEKGYGAAGAPGAIPPNATIIFDVELLAIQ